MEKIMIFCSIIFLVNLISYFLIREFKCPIKYHIISLILSESLVFLLYEYNLSSLIFICLFEVLLIVSFIDVKHFEVSNIIYLLIFIPVLINFIFSSAKIELLISFVIVYGTFWIFDKFVGIEKLGGADVKVILLLSFYFLAADVLLFIIYIFLISAILFMIERCIRKTYCDLAIPMLVSITISFFIGNFSLYCSNYFF